MEYYEILRLREPQNTLVMAFPIWSVRTRERGTGGSERGADVVEVATSYFCEGHTSVPETGARDSCILTARARIQSCTREKRKDTKRQTRVQQLHYLENEDNLRIRR